MELKTRVWLGTIILFLFMPSYPAYAQTQLAGTVGITNSVNMGEIGPAPIFKSTLTTGDAFRFEDALEFSPIDKYTKAGWYVKNGVNILVFPSKSGLFIILGGDFSRRDGGVWAKEGVRVGAGLGYENKKSQFRFSVKDKVFSWNDDIKYFPYFEFLTRGDYPIRDSNWNFRVETEAGLFKYIQNNAKRTAFYSNAAFGFAYKWP